MAAARGRPGPPPVGLTPVDADLARVEQELADVEHALARLDAGTYGTCEVCGSLLGDEALRAAPAARSCADHA
jgi:DnaK suppressor protein